MSYKSGHIYLVDKEPTNEELANFSKPVQFDICKDGLFYSILYDKNGNRYVEDRSKITTGFIKLGTIVRVGNVINIGVHPSGFNHWRINGVDVTSSNPVVLELEPETILYRIDSIVGNSAGGIFIFQGDANKNPLPTNSLNYPNYAFFKDVLITPNSGGSIDPEILNNYVSKEEESWKEITLGISSDFVIYYSDERTRFKISSLGSAGHTLTGIVFSDNTERAVEFWVYNNTGADININNVATSRLRKGFQIYGESFKIIANGKALLKYNPDTDIIECWKDNSIGGDGGISSVTTDATLQGTGSPTDPLGLSVAKNDEIAGKISKQGINLGDSGNIPEMKTGAISGIYRGHGASNAVYDFSPFYQMVTADTFAQIHINYVNGEMAYRAGNVANGYSPIRISWDTGNLVNPATQTWVNQYFLGADTAIAAGFVNGNKEIPYIRHSDMTVVGLATTNWVTTQTTPATQAEVEASTGTESNPTSSEPATENRKFLSLFNFFKLIKKLRYIHLLPNSATATANRLRSDGSNLYFANNSSIESKLLYDNEGYISVTGDVTVDNSYHGRIVRVSANCNITLSSTLRNDFIAYFVVIGNYTVTFVEGSGVTFYAPYGKKMLEGNTCYAQKSSDTKFDLIGTLTPV